MPKVALANVIEEDIETDRRGRELGAPTLAKPLSLIKLMGESKQAATDEDPVDARTRVRWQRARRAAILMRRPLGVCRKAHDLTDPDNVYVGKNGSQCRLCRNQSRRNARARKNQSQEVAHAPG